MNLDKIFDDIVETIKTPKEEVQPEPKKDLMTDMVQECFSQHEASSNKYKCECGTIVPKLVFENEEGKCPKCGKTMSAFFEDTSINEKRYNCPRCQASFLYERAMECSCPVCSTLMDVYAPLNKDGKDTGMIPMSM